MRLSYRHAALRIPVRLAVSGRDLFLVHTRQRIAIGNKNAISIIAMSFLDSYIINLSSPYGYWYRLLDNFCNRIAYLGKTACASRI